MQTAKNSGWTVETAKRIAVVASLLVSFSVAQAQTVAIATVPSPAKDKSWFQRTFGRTEWSEVGHAYATPREICRLVEQNISYRTEDNDTWSTAAETWARGKGDCEDMAICVQELCKLSGMTSKVHLYFPATGGREGHAVLVGEWNGKMWFSSNGSYEEVSSEKEVRQRVAKMLSCKESQLWGMKLSEADVAKYIEKSPARAVAAASPR